MGTLPNHFVLEVDRGAPNVARAGIQALNDTWQQVCRAVWTQFVEHVCPAGDGTEHIWNRQVQGYWEAVWTAGEAGDGMLARRKHWRSHRLPDEPGDKCTVMHDLQELSGHVRAESCERIEKQDWFWGSVRRRLGRLDLRDNERLCAITLVKRMFPKVAAGELGLGIDESHWPSTVYVGAVPWIRRVLCAAPQQACQYAGIIRKSAGDVIAEHRPPFQGLRVNEAGDFPRLDANYFHREFVKNKRLCPLDDNAASGMRDELDHLLKTIYQSEDDSNRQLGSPPSFYALLFADGDHLGRLVGELDGRSVGQALATFTAKAPEIVREHDGVTIYAGGDDVLAMLPVPQALSCAAFLSRCYKSAFSGHGYGGGDALSGGHVRPCPIAPRRSDRRDAPVARRCGQGREWTGFVGERSHEAWRTALAVGNDLDAKTCRWCFVMRIGAARRFGDASRPERAGCRSLVGPHLPNSRNVRHAVRMVAVEARRLG